MWRRHRSLDFCCAEQHSGGCGASWGAHGAGILGPHPNSAAQPRSGGQLLCRWHSRSFDVTRGGGLDAEPRASVVTAGTAGRKQLNCSPLTRVKEKRSWFWVVYICFFPQHNVIMKWPPPECEMVAYRWNPILIHFTTHQIRHSLKSLQNVKIKGRHTNVFSLPYWPFHITSLLLWFTILCQVLLLPRPLLLISAIRFCLSINSLVPFGILIQSSSLLCTHFTECFMSCIFIWAGVLL